MGVVFWPVCASGVGAPDPHTPAAHPLISFSVRTAALSPLAAGSCPYSLVLSSSSVSLVKTVQLCSLRRFHSRSSLFPPRPRATHQSSALQPQPLLPGATSTSCTIGPGTRLSQHLLPLHLSKINKFLLFIPLFLLFCFCIYVYSISIF